MAEMLKEVADRLADDLARQIKTTWATEEHWQAAFKDALHEAIRAAQAKPTGTVLIAAADISDGYENLTGADVVRIFNGVAAKRLEELE